MFEKKVLSPLEIRSGIFRIFRKAAECIFVFCCISVHTLNAQNDFPIQPVFVYTADVAANVSGGISTGIGYLGYAVAGVEFDIGKAGWWKRGSLVLTGGCTHGYEPSAQWHITDCLSWQAVVLAHFRDGFLGFAHKESSVELTYRYVLNEHCYLQPDVQYILHPSAAEQTADNALFGAVRLGVEF